MINHLEWKENINYYYERRSETIIGDTNLISIWYSPDYNFINI